MAWTEKGARATYPYHWRVLAELQTCVVDLCFFLRGLGSKSADSISKHSSFVLFLVLNLVSLASIVIVLDNFWSVSEGNGILLAITSLVSGDIELPSSL